MLDTPAHAVGAERGRAEIPGRTGSGHRRSRGRGRRTVWRQPPKRAHVAGALPARRDRGAGGPQPPGPSPSLAHPAEIEEAMCELRRAHPKWGLRRLVFEMGRRGHQVTRSSVYRTLVRNGLVEPKSRRRRRKDYRRWERAAAMELWQLDVTASAFLTDGTEVKIVTGVDDHSRF